MNSISKIWNKLRNPEYRKAFVASQINIAIPFQLYALLKSRGWTQAQLAERAGMLQPRISAMLKPGKTRFNIETLRRLAEAFDCGLVVRFAPFSELVRWSEQFNPELFDVPSFSQEEEGRPLYFVSTRVVSAESFPQLNLGAAYVYTSIVEGATVFADWAAPHNRGEIAVTNPSLSIGRRHPIVEEAERIEMPKRMFRIANVPQGSSTDTGLPRSIDLGKAS